MQQHWLGSITDTVLSLRSNYGILSISEQYDRCMAEAFTGLSGFQCIVDDIVK